MFKLEPRAIPLLDSFSMEVRTSSKTSKNPFLLVCVSRSTKDPDLGGVLYLFSAEYGSGNRETGFFVHPVHAVFTMGTVSILVPCRSD